MGTNSDISLSGDSSEDLQASTNRSQAALIHDPMSCWTERDGTAIVLWKFDKRKLKGKDTALSQHFGLTMPDQRKVGFVIMLNPKPRDELRGGKRFQNCETGIVSLKCKDVQSAAGVDVVFRIGMGGQYASESPRGPVRHDFGSGSTIRGLSAVDENWTLKDTVDEATRTVSVRVEIAPFSTQTGEARL